MNSLLQIIRPSLRPSFNGGLRAFLTITRPLSTRALPIPEPKEPIASPEAFLKAIGRSCDTKLSVETWDELWNHNGTKLKTAGVNVRDRRYILWCMEKYRSGLSPDEFAHEPRAKKTIRGWGPAVQNGKRIRSRRNRNNKPKKKKKKEDN
ncbi:protein FYV4, mitochondrial [Favolaschia claudopus]|uniref:Small ribosomal subunit protein mS41 n=1 Tax=Favolaschia claudopus TaxID=2862362 RepID=A0AAW0DAL3_9AGAR